VIFLLETLYVYCVILRDNIFEYIWSGYTEVIVKYGSCLHAHHEAIQEAA